MLNSDVDLMSRLRGRDSLALTEIYDCHAKTVFGLLVYITHNDHTAEDLMQELFLRVWNRHESFDPARGSLKGWLLSIARNMAIDHLRNAQRHGKNKCDSLECAEIRNVLSSVDPTRVQIWKLSINAAFTHLRSCERTVLELAYFQGYSQTEIAGLLGQPLGTVKSWTRSGLRSLRMNSGLAAKGGESTEKLKTCSMLNALT